MKRRLRYGGLRSRLLAAFVLVALVSAATATGLAYRESRTAVLKRAQQAVMADFLEQVGEAAADVDMPPDRRSLIRFAENVSNGLDRGTLVVAHYRDLRVTSDTMADQTRITPELRAAVRAGGRTNFQRVERDGEPYLVVGTAVTFDDGSTSGLEVFTLVSLREEQEDLAGLLDAVREGILVVVLMSAGMALLAALTVLRPVRDLGRATRNLASGDLSTRVGVKGTDELADLAATFNRTADALETTVAELHEQREQARRFVADVSHELRTPLAAMTMVSSVLDEDAPGLPPDTAQAARTISEETARLSRLVGDLIEISRFDAKVIRLNSAETDLGEIVRSTLALRGWTTEVRAELPEGVHAVVDKRRIDLVVANLVGNALRHGAPPVAVVLQSSDEEITIEVTDSGPGLPPEVMPHVFDRFYKADSARTRSDGSGLGMAIALENARLHDGTIEAANRPEGGGAVFTLRLPRQRPEGDRHPGSDR
ncbi:HAMP domain-containing sensor histidine kinase [Streptomyces sp. NPDC002054]|uniref:HAMP domain-containing sensor histidine kinase n=1 Tax=Streptomyces sp. NPDC002054 TaxID=3154663 RepID=UPI00332CE1F8